jgi:hypothetical protein
MAAKPLLQSWSSLGAAVVTMGAKGGRLNENLEMQVRAERGATLMIDSTSPVKLLPSDDSQEFGIGIHASIEDKSLLVITPEAHVPHLDAWTGLWTRYDLSPGASLVSVQLADLKAQAARPPKVGGRYTSRTRIHHTKPGPGSVDSNFVNAAPEYTQFRADDSLSHVGASCSLPSVSSCGRRFAAEPSWSCDWTFGRRFKGLVMGSPTTNVIASILLTGPRARAVTDQFRALDNDLDKHSMLGLRGDAHLALQDVSMPSDGNEGGSLVIARVGTEHREDMHRLLHHCLAPLAEELGVAPYSRMLKASRTASGSLSVDVMPGSQPFVENPGLHVQRGELRA